MCQKTGGGVAACLRETISAVEEIYAPVLANHNIRIRVLVGKPKKVAALTAMGIETAVGSDKLDLALHINGANEIFGGIHNCGQRSIPNRQAFRRGQALWLTAMFPRRIAMGWRRGHES